MSFERWQQHLQELVPITITSSSFFLSATVVRYFISLSSRSSCYPLFINSIHMGNINYLYYHAHPILHKFNVILWTITRVIINGRLLENRGHRRCFIRGHCSQWCNFHHYNYLNHGCHENGSCHGYSFNILNIIRFIWPSFS